MTGLTIEKLREARRLLANEANSDEPRWILARSEDEARVYLGRRLTFRERFRLRRDGTLPVRCAL